MQVSQCAGDLRCIEPGSGLEEAALSLQVVEQLEHRGKQKKVSLKQVQRAVLFLITKLDYTVRIIYISRGRKLMDEKATIKKDRDRKETGWEEIKRQDGDSLKSLTREDR